MARVLESYVGGRWGAADGEGQPLLDAATGDEVARVTGLPIAPVEVLNHARQVGGPALRAMTFQQRAVLLKEIALALDARKEELYELSYATGATRKDSWIDIDGGIGTVFAIASRSRRGLPDDHVATDGDYEPIGKNGTFVGQHVWTPLRGALLQINAFNFPVWGALEKFAPSFVAGLPSIIKPASQTSYLTQLMVQIMVESGLLPEGSLQLIVGGVGDMFEHLTGQDCVAFTGSASTAQQLRTHPAVARNSVRFGVEADSLNASVLGPDAAPGTAEFDLYIKEVTREMTVKAGQKCTAIRRVIVPRQHQDAVIDAIRARLEKVVVGDPRDEATTMGALSSLHQRDEVKRSVKVITEGARVVVGDPDEFSVASGDAVRGAFLPPLLLLADDADRAEPHEVEAFGPVATVIGYSDAAQSTELLNRGGGSLVASVFTADPSYSRHVVVESAGHHGRIMFVDETSARESTGHGSPLPILVHGGPGRAGGGEELGGVRGVFHFLQRTALQGAPATLTAAANRWIPGAAQQTGGTHLFRRTFNELQIGDALVSEPREVTLEDVERFADLSGDHFYAHMDEEAAAANPFFEGRVAHGYFVVSLAAGLFVDPAPGPVLANYGLEGLRFTTPVYPGDVLRVTLTCKQKTPRPGQEYGEVRWDANVRNQEGETVAAYDVLTLVALD